MYALVYLTKKYVAINQIYCFHKVYCFLWDVFGVKDEEIFLACVDAHGLPVVF